MIKVLSRSKLIRAAVVAGAMAAVPATASAAAPQSLNTASAQSTSSTGTIYVVVPGPRMRF